MLTANLLAMAQAKPAEAPNTKRYLTMTTKLTADARAQMEALRNEVYSEIFALPSFREQQAALHYWYKGLEATCTKENKCIECLLQEDSFESEDEEDW